jgi:hypothetical protein
VARAANKVIEGRVKRGRKRKCAAPEADEPEAEVALIIDVSVPWKAPVARMPQPQAVENQIAIP